MTPGAFIRGGDVVELISKSVLDDFSRRYDKTDLEEKDRFEHLAAYITVRLHHDRLFNTSDVVVGGGGDNSVDAVAIIVNGLLITDIDELAQFDNSTDLDVTFVFVQADRSPNFSSSKIGDIGVGVETFFQANPAFPRNAAVAAKSEIAVAIYQHYAKFARGNPAVRIYYVTTGKWEDDQTLQARMSKVVADLQATDYFSEVTFEPVDARRLAKLFHRTQNAIARNFDFVSRVVMPRVDGVKQAHIGVVPAMTLINLLINDAGDSVMQGLFYENVRAKLPDTNKVNREISDTLRSPSKARFALMNNGVTIIAKRATPTGNTFRLEKYFIVNGCQTSHVLFDCLKELDDSVLVPVRLIETENEQVIDEIIRSTNRQTSVKESRFFITTEFPKQLERFFIAHPEPDRRLYFERRECQYDRDPSAIKPRIIDQDGIIRAYAAMFLDLPHRTTRNFKMLSDQQGKTIFGKNHKYVSYYTAAFALHRVEAYLKTHKFPAKYNITKYHILMALRHIANAAPLPPPTTNKREQYCSVVNAMLWDDVKADALVRSAISVIEEAAAGEFARDHIRTEAFTNTVHEKLKSQL
jgi:hypothetical protein